MSAPEHTNFLLKLTPEEMALRALIIVGSHGYDSLDEFQLSVDIDRKVAISTENEIDLSEIVSNGNVKDHADEIRTILTYASKLVIEAKGKKIEISMSNGSFSVEEAESSRENGTSTFFESAPSDIQNIFEAAKKITAIVAAITGHELNDSLSDEERLDSYSIGKGTWADRSGKTQDVEYHMTRCNGYNFVPSLFNAFTQQIFEIGLFDGKWYYPSSSSRRGFSSFGIKNVWEVDDFIAEIPFGTFEEKAPEPGPRSPRAPHDYSPVFGAVRTAMPISCQATLGNPQEATKLANWYTEGYHHALTGLNFSQQQIEVSNGLFTISNYNKTASISLDMSEFKACGEYSIEDIFETENAVGFLVGFTALGATIAKGPYIIGDVPEDLIAACGYPVSKNSGASRPYRSALLPPYEACSSKKGGDAAFAHGYAPSGELKYASARTQDSIKSGTLLDKLTPLAPAGCIMARTLARNSNIDWRWSRPATLKNADTKQFDCVVIVDASKTGIQPARMSVSTLFETAQDIPDKSKTPSAQALLLCLPPKDDQGSSWSKKELDEIKKNWQEMAKAIAADHVQFIASDELEKCVEKEKARKKERRSNSSAVTKDARLLEEFRKMLGDSKVTLIENLKDTSSSINRRSRMGWHRKAEEIAEKLISEADQWGIVVVQEAEHGYYGYPSTSELVAQTLFALELVPENVNKICSIEPSHWNAKRAKTTRDLGVSILYDNSGKAPDVTPMFSIDTFTNAPSATFDDEPTGYPSRHMDRRTFPMKIAYTGEVDEKLADSTENLERMRIVGELYDGLAEQFQSQDAVRGFRNKVEIPIDQMPMFVRAMSYDALEIDNVEIPTSKDVECGYPHSETCRADIAWRMKILSNVRITQAQDKVTATMCDPELVKKFADVCRLWKTRLFEGAGMTFTVTAVGEHNIDTFQGVGTACGLDTAIEAYMLGVPVEDLTV